MYYYVLKEGSFNDYPLIIHANNRVEIYRVLESATQSFRAKRYNTFREAFDAYFFDDGNFYSLWDFNVQPMLKRLHLRTTRHDNIYYL